MSIGFREASPLPPAREDVPLQRLAARRMATIGVAVLLVCILIYGALVVLSEIAA